MKFLIINIINKLRRNKMKINAEIMFETCPSCGKPLDMEYMLTNIECPECDFPMYDDIIQIDMRRMGIHNAVQAYWMGGELLESSDNGNWEAGCAKAQAIINKEFIKQEEFLEKRRYKLFTICGIPSICR